MDNKYNTESYYFLSNNIDYYNREYMMENNSKYTDEGGNPFVVDIKELAKKNLFFRRVLWTGDNLQLTVMCINKGECIGLEMHQNIDQFILVEQGIGNVKMGDSENNLYFDKKVCKDYAIIIPAGKWHNLINIGDSPLKLISIYAPIQHKKGTIHVTKEDENH